MPWLESEEPLGGADCFYGKTRQGYAISQGGYGQLGHWPMVVFLGKNSCGLYFSYAGLVEMKGGGWTGVVGAASPPLFATCHRGETIA
jgi:hypothetical protein